MKFPLQKVLSIVWLREFKLLIVKNQNATTIKGSVGGPKKRTRPVSNEWLMIYAIAQNKVGNN